MSTVIPDYIIKTTHMSEDEILQELAIILYKKSKLTLSQASKLSNMTYAQFQFLLASRNISINYDTSDLQHDLETLKKTSRI